MEIRHYLRAIRRRLWIVALLPLGAVGITAALQVAQPEKYQTTATVIVPALSQKGYSTSAVTQYFSTFKDVLVSKPVVTAVSKQTGVSEKELVANLTASTASA